MEASKYSFLSKCSTHGYYSLRKSCILKPRIRGSFRSPGQYVLFLMGCVECTENPPTWVVFDEVFLGIPRNSLEFTGIPRNSQEFQAPGKVPTKFPEKAPGLPSRWTDLQLRSSYEHPSLTFSDFLRLSLTFSDFVKLSLTFSTLSTFSNFL